MSWGDEMLTVDYIKRVSLLATVFVLALALVLTSGALIETNRAGYIKIKQAAVVGTLNVHDEPGMFPQLFGEVFEYKKADTFFFSKYETEGGSMDESIPVRFNDGATANITGNVRFELPKSKDNLLDVHQKFRSYESLVHEGIQQVVSESVILTAALMTAEESYTTQRAHFAELAWDQVANGVYITERYESEIIDPRTGETTTKTLVKIKRDDSGAPVRKANPLEEYGIRLFQFVIKDIDYEQSVQTQIAAKRAALMDVVEAKANAEKAIQDRKTAEEVGKKNVAVAQYEAEVEKIRAVVQGQKEKEVAELQAAKKLQVAELDAQAADLEKKAVMTRAEAEASRARKLLEADGALDRKLATVVRIHELWAAAYTAQRPTPDIVMGGEDGALTGPGPNPAMSMMEVLTLESLKQLQTDLQVK